MEIKYLEIGTSEDNHQYGYIHSSEVGNSDAILLSINKGKIATISIHSVSGGTVSLEYTTARKEHVQDDTAVFIKSAIDSASASAPKSTSIDTPVTFVRFIASTSTTSYAIEVLIARTT